MVETALQEGDSPEFFSNVCAPVILKEPIYCGFNRVNQLPDNFNIVKFNSNHNSDTSEALEAITPVYLDLNDIFDENFLKCKESEYIKKK